MGREGIQLFVIKRNGSRVVDSSDTALVYVGSRVSRRYTRALESEYLPATEPQHWTTASRKCVHFSMISTQALTRQLAPVLSKEKGLFPFCISCFCYLFSYEFSRSTFLRALFDCSCSRKIISPIAQDLSTPEIFGDWSFLHLEQFRRRFVRFSNRLRSFLNWNLSLY